MKTELVLKVNPKLLTEQFFPEPFRLSVSLPWVLHCLRKDFFSERVVNHWNSLPNNVKLSTSVDTFIIIVNNAI